MAIYPFVKSPLGMGTTWPVEILSGSPTQSMGLMLLPSVCRPQSTPTAGSVPPEPGIQQKDTKHADGCEEILPCHPWVG